MTTTSTTLTLLLNFGVVDVCDEIGVLFESGTYYVHESPVPFEMFTICLKNECAAACMNKV